MNDAYAEWIVKRKKPVYTFAVIPVMIILCIISAFLALTTNVIWVIIATLIFLGTYIIFRNLKVEYEYIFVSGQLTVDKILGQSKRKKALTCDVENMLVVAPADSYLVKDQVNANTKTQDFTSQMPNAKVYALVYQDGPNRTKVLFEPNTKIMNCLRQSAPRKVTL